jgi:predicted amidohydrolase
VPARDDLRNSAALLADGREVGRYHKARLPAYGVFDADRGVDDTGSAASATRHHRATVGRLHPMNPAR